MKADSAQVTEQTGLFIGKEGMDLTVNGKLKTKGGAITSSAPAEKNHLRVAGIEAENIENHSYISVENASVGVSTQMGANVANAIGAGLNALRTCTITTTPPLEVRWAAISPLTLVMAAKISPSNSKK